jgi:predicted transcriptional regulator
LHTLAPDLDAEEAIRAMRAFAVRRIPVVEHGQAVGIVSIGDLAMSRGGRSVLADISATPPNN